MVSSATIRSDASKLTQTLIKQYYILLWHLDPDKKFEKPCNMKWDFLKFIWDSFIFLFDFLIWLYFLWFLSIYYFHN